MASVSGGSGGAAAAAVFARAARRDSALAGLDMRGRVLVVVSQGGSAEVARDVYDSSLVCY